MKSLRIANRMIGVDHPAFVIAEIGVNHDGSPERAEQLVHAAARAGADAIKLQIFRADQLMNAASRFAEYQKNQCAENEPAEMLRHYELSESQLARVIATTRQLGLIPLATPFSLPDVELLRRFDLPAVKIASPDLVNRPLLQKSAALGKPLLLSTGAAALQEIQTSIQWLRQWGASFALLHCVSSYPTPIEKANLCWITELANRFDLPIGYSDHTADVLSGALAIAAGACIIEKHLTYDRKAQGPDHAASSDPEQFAEYVRMVRHAEKLRGSRGKCVLDIECDVRTVSRQSLVAAGDLPGGHCIAETDLRVQRPGTGIPAAEFDTVLGRKTARAIPAGTLLQWDMLQ
jgi:N,N'-diacetyllegionaminate synthase